jgi:hypothetical protein
MKIKREPYRVNIAEVTREVFDSDLKWKADYDFL